MGRILPLEDRHKLTIADQIAGGKVRSESKKYAARLRELKKKGLKDDTIKRITDIMEDPSCSILDIKMLLDGVRSHAVGTKEDPGDPEFAIKLSKAYINLHIAHHGSKHKITGEMNHNVRAITINLNAMPKKNGRKRKT